MPLKVRKNRKFSYRNLEAIIDDLQLIFKRFDFIRIVFFSKITFSTKPAPISPISWHFSRLFCENLIVNKFVYKTHLSLRRTTRSHSAPKQEKYFAGMHVHKTFQLNKNLITAWFKIATVFQCTLYRTSGILVALLPFECFFYLKFIYLKNQ